MTDSAEPPAVEARTRAHVAAAILSVVEALVLLGFVAFYVVEMVSGATTDLTRAATSGVLILVVAVFLAAVARGWWRRSDWVRTPTLLWNALLLPVAWSLHESDRTWLAIGVAVLAVASIVAALAVPPREPVGAGGDGGEGSR